MRHYRQLTYELQYQIYTLNQEGYSQKAIDDVIGVNQSTNDVYQKFWQAMISLQASLEQVWKLPKTSGQPIKMMSGNIELIDEGIRQEWGPEKVSGL